MSSSPRIKSFALNLPLFHGFDYRVDTPQTAEAGMRYQLPFGSGDKIGILLPGAPNVSADTELKLAGAALDDAPVLSDHLIQLAKWLADYYCQPIGEVMFQCLPRYLRADNRLKSVSIELWRATASAAEALPQLETRAPRQHTLLSALLAADEGLDAAQLRQIHADWRQPLRSLEARGLVSKELCEPLQRQQIERQTSPELVDEQQHAVQAIAAGLDEFRVDVIDGITGSGKTEVYLALMQRVLDAGGQVLYLVPEIGLTPQLIGRLQAALGPVVVSAHSAQSDFARYQSWDQFRRGAAGVLVGTRSAIFSEATSLQLIVLDEEHDPSYRQQDGVRYHARDVAIKRAQMLDIPILLGSATPSLETLHNLGKPHFHHHRLTQRPGAAVAPQIRLIDSSKVNLNDGCSPQLLQAMRKNLEQQGQVLLFLNRRGFAPVVRCHSCGWQAMCHQCDARMTLHQSLNRLICHHCGHGLPLPTSCPDCGQAEIRHYGVGTERLQQFLQSHFTETPVIRIDRDSVSDAIQIHQLLQPVRDGEPCILLGTQMIAKGHDYPNITLVGIIDADQALHSGFYRAGERLVQTVLQVAGRAGRAERPGLALLQTAFPEHDLMSKLCHQDYAALVRPLLEERKLLGFPPFARVVTLVADAQQLEPALQRLKAIHDVFMALPDRAGVRIVGPIPALMTRRIGRYRAQLSLLSNDARALRRVLKLLQAEIQRVRNTQRLRLVVEVDPLDL